MAPLASERLSTTCVVSWRQGCGASRVPWGARRIRAATRRRRWSSRSSGPDDRSRWRHTSARPWWSRRRPPSYQSRHSRTRVAEASCRPSSTGPSTKRTSLEARGWRRDLHWVRRFASMRRDPASLMSSDNSFPVLAPIPGPATVPSAMESRESREPVAPHCQQAPAGAPRKPRQRQFPQRLG